MYREEVMRTYPNFTGTSLTDKLTNGALGLAGESGEVADLVKKALFYGKSLDREALILELGDVRWYLEVLAASLDLTMEEIEAANVAKLQKRYPTGFPFGHGK